MTAIPEKEPWYKTQVQAPPEEAQGFILKFWDAKGKVHPYVITGQKRQQWELDAGKTPLFCDKYAMQRARKILGKNMHRVKTAILIHRASNEIALKWIYNKGYLKSEEIVELRFYRQGQYSLTFISKII